MQSGDPKTTHLLLFPESEQTNARDLDDLKPYSGNITLGLATATEARDQNFVVLVHKVQATVILQMMWHSISTCSAQSATETYRDKGCHLLSVLNQLYPDTFADSRVGLLGLDTDLLEDDAFGVR